MERIWKGYGKDMERIWKERIMKAKGNETERIRKRYFKDKERIWGG